jgi:uncharacterized protein
MKKIFLLLTLTSTLLFPASFDCKKAKTDVEKLICSDKELSQLDEELNEAYKALKTLFTIEEDYTCGKYETIGDINLCEMDKALRLDEKMIKTYKIFINKNKEELKKQREWLKQTNLCKDKDCVKNAQKTRVDEINKEIKTFSNNLLKAQKEAKDNFKQTNSIVEPIHLFDRVNANALIKVKPSFLTNEEYVNFLYDYAYYLSIRVGTKIYETDHTFWKTYIEAMEETNFPTEESMKYMHSDGKRLETAIKALKRAKEIAPNNINVSKLLAKNHLKLFVFSRANNMCPRSRDCITTEPNYEYLPFLTKKAYLDYVKLSKANNVKPELDEIEQAIVNRQRMFFEISSTFDGDVSLVHSFSKTDYRLDDPKLKNICKEYVALLNKIPDNNLTVCSRYANENNSLFEFVKYDDAPDKHKKDTYASGRNNNRYWFLIKYKNKYFLDHYNALYSADNPNTIDFDKDNFCRYEYMDLSLEYQHGFDSYDCYSIENYDQIYKNGKE